MEVLNRLERLWKRPAKGRGVRKRVKGVTALVEDYRDLKRLARQVKAHAEMAPYPHVSQRLNQIAQEKEESASRLKDKVVYLRDEALEESVNNFYTGKNHWERMLRDIADQKDLEDRWAEDVIFMVQESPEISDLLNQIIAEGAAHREAFQALLATADPQAWQS